MNFLLSVLLYVSTGFLILQQSGALTITVTNIHPVDGKLYIAVYDTEEHYMSVEQAAFKKIAVVKDKKQEISFTDIPDGEYAVAVFQDLNGNGQLDTMKNGIPNEPFGFSNDARGRIGPPKYKKAMFLFSGPMSIEIKLINHASK